MDETLAGAAEPAAPRRLWPFLVPIAIFAGIGVLLYLGLFRDPSLVPSPLIGKPVPEFALGPVQGRTLGLSSEDLREEVTLVNVFASWCVACRDEHPLFLVLEREGVVPIHGLNYKDAPADAAAWLDALGDPYTRCQERKSRNSTLPTQIGIIIGEIGFTECDRGVSHCGHCLQVDFTPLRINFLFSIKDVSGIHQKRRESTLPKFFDNISPSRQSTRLFLITPARLQMAFRATCIQDHHRRWRAAFEC